MYTDAHSHLHLPELRSQLDEIIAANSQFDITCASANAHDWPLLLNLRRELRQSHPQGEIRCYLGFHPQEAPKIDSLDSALDALGITIEENREDVAGLGEIGLDSALISSLPSAQRAAAKQEQQNLLLGQIEIAQRLNLPVQIHCVKAHGTMVELLKSHPIPSGSLVHGYSGSLETLREYLKLGLDISLNSNLLSRAFSPAGDECQRIRWRELICAIPPQRLRVESDSCVLENGIITEKRDTFKVLSIILKAY